MESKKLKKFKKESTLLSMFLIFIKRRLGIDQKFRLHDSSEQDHPSWEGAYY